jgi:hypothetical protein
MINPVRAPSRHDPVPQRAASFVERRGTHRIHLVCRFARVTGCGDEGLWRVRNISDFGMMLRSRCHARPGEPLSIALSDRIQLEAKVAWSDAEHVGVRFAERIDATALLCALAEEQRLPGHRSLRLDVDGRALAFDDAGVHSVKVRNISRHGARLEHRDRLRRGTAIKLVFENGAERRGVVRWADQEQAGLFLFEPFTPDELASARRF